MLLPCRTLLMTKSTLAQVMAACHQATSHYLSQARSMLPYGITSPQWVDGTSIHIGNCLRVAINIQNWIWYWGLTLLMVQYHGPATTIDYLPTEVHQGFMKSHLPFLPSSTISADRYCPFMHPSVWMSLMILSLHLYLMIKISAWYVVG